MKSIRKIAAVFAVLALCVGIASAYDYKCQLVSYPAAKKAKVVSAISQETNTAEWRVSQMIQTLPAVVMDSSAISRPKELTEKLKALGCGVVLITPEGSQATTVAAKYNLKIDSIDTSSSRKARVMAWLKKSWSSANADKIYKDAVKNRGKCGVSYRSDMSENQANNEITSARQSGVELAKERIN